VSHNDNKKKEKGKKRSGGGKEEIICISDDDTENNTEHTEDCCVCYEPVPRKDFLECKHAVCQGCIGQLRDTRCPMCRTEIKSRYVDGKEKRKMIRRRQEDDRNRTNELFQSFIQAQQNQEISIQPTIQFHHNSNFFATFSTHF
jgi:hypothetical protein